MDQPSTTEALRLWLRKRAATGGLLLAVALVTLLATVLTVLYRPQSYGPPIDGVIIKFIWYGKGSDRAALVRVPDGDFMVRLPQTTYWACRVGDRIHVIPSESLVGRRYGAAGAMPCSAGAHG
jgi:hypothetical protein